jgi:hypothetical protein
MLAHQPLDAITTDAFAGAPQRLPHPAVAVGVVVGGVDLADAVQEALVAGHARRSLAAGAVVVRGRRHAQGPADRLDAEAAAVLLDESGHFVRSVSSSLDRGRDRPFGRPPRRSQRALLTHWAPCLGFWRQTACSARDGRCGAAEAIAPRCDSSASSSGSSVGCGAEAPATSLGPDRSGTCRSSRRCCPCGAAADAASDGCCVQAPAPAIALLSESGGVSGRLNTCGWRLGGREQSWRADTSGVKDPHTLARGHCALRGMERSCRVGEVALDWARQRVSPAQEHAHRPARPGREQENREQRSTRELCATAWRVGRIPRPRDSSTLRGRNSLVIATHAVSKPWPV